MGYSQHNIAAFAALDATSAKPEVAHNGTLTHRTGVTQMNSMSAKDGTEIYFKDWGSGHPVVLAHGWPLSADAWDAQMLYLV